MANPRNLANIAPLFAKSSSDTVDYSGTNLKFSGTAQRFLIKTDGAQADRFAFQSTATNGNTRLWIYPSGTGNITGVAGHTSASDFTNYNAFDLAVLGGASQEVRLSSNAAGTATAYPITFRIGGSEQMRLDSSGNLGIGTSSPGEKLNVIGGNSTTSTVNFTGANGVDNATIASDYNLVFQVDANNNVGGREFNWRYGGKGYSDGTSLMTLDSSGNLGIGTSSPASKLEVYNSAVNAAFVANNPSTWRVAQFRNDQVGVSGTAAGIAFVGRTDTSPAGIVAINGNTTGGVVSLGFLTVDSNITAERMRLDSSGNLGIATTNPGARLGVYGSGNLVRLGDGTSTHDLRFMGPNNWDLQLNTTTDIFSVRRNSVSYFSVTSDGIAETRKVSLTDANGFSRYALSYSNWGYSSAYKTLVIGSASTSYNVNVTGAITVSFNYDPSANTNSAFSGDGREILFRRGTRFVTPNAADNAFNLYNLVLLDGNVGIGTDNPQAKIEIYPGSILSSAAQEILRLDVPGSDIFSAASGYINFRGYDVSNSAQRDIAYIAAKLEPDLTGAPRFGGSLIFSTCPTGASQTPTERARITSGGDLLVGTQTEGGVGISLYNQANSGNIARIDLNKSASGASTGMSFRHNGTSVGAIIYSNTDTTYVTTSDYRLKDNPQPLTGSGAFIDALQPKTWEWKIDGSKGVGFIAHEAQAVSPSSVVGEKDAVDADGKPVMQAMEYGSAEFIANIIAELQSLRARVAALEVQ